jgi:hypothetical protein
LESAYIDRYITTDHGVETIDDVEILKGILA